MIFLPCRVFSGCRPCEVSSTALYQAVILSGGKRDQSSFSAARNRRFSAYRSVIRQPRLNLGYQGFELGVIGKTLGVKSGSESSQLLKLSSA